MQETGVWPPTPPSPDLNTPWPLPNQEGVRTAADSGFGDGSEAARGPSGDALHVPGVSGVSGFIPADEPLELPGDGPRFTREQVGAATSGSQIHRGTTDVLDLPKTQRMLIGLVSEAIARRELTQEEVCRLTGLSAPYVSQLLNGRRTGTFAVWDMLLDIARFDYNGLGRYAPPDMRFRRGRKPKAAPHADE